jgi:hypothetical protein
MCDHVFWLIVTMFLTMLDNRCWSCLIIVVWRLLTMFLTIFDNVFVDCRPWCFDDVLSCCLMIVDHVIWWVLTMSFDDVWPCVLTLCMLFDDCWSCVLTMCVWRLWILFLVYIDQVFTHILHIQTSGFWQCQFLYWEHPKDWTLTFLGHFWEHPKDRTPPECLLQC